jgi:hypothetical protein
MVIWKSHGVMTGYASIHYRNYVKLAPVLNVAAGINS